MTQQIHDKHVYESIVFDRNFQRDTLNEALEIVKTFIIERNCILVGGMAIDMALRQKGSQLYPDNTLPDYDFYSPNFHRDAYDLGERLAKKFKDISVIRAIHVSTMKVRVEYVVVADITYIPKNVFDILPTIKHAGMKIIHPHYQMIDQHRSLCYPYSGPPREAILSRWKKDIERYDMLNQYFPTTEIKGPTKSHDYKIKSISLSLEEMDSCCLTGVGAFLYWYSIAKELGFSRSSKHNIGKITIEDQITIDLPEDLHVSFYTDDLWEVKTRFEKKVGRKEEKKKSVKTTKTVSCKWYNSFVEKIPRKVIINNEIEIFDNKGSLISAHKPFETRRVWIMNLQGCMLYFMSRYIQSQQYIYADYYNIAQEILFFICALYKSDDNDKERLKKCLLLLPSTDVYGQYNWSESYIMSRRDFLSSLQETVKVQMTPKNAYPTKDEPVNKQNYTFDPTESEIYQFDGEEVSEFTPVELPS